ncbi:hypothetical protein BaRGS_00023894 [Batillaria attramentaria]|uniref:Uncharacterized protein n=1 Tax=Batillaria attramentaria TaxID=370345 RepID=A0ABD0KCZ0_9CAEN
MSVSVSKKPPTSISRSADIKIMTSSASRRAYVKGKPISITGSADVKTALSPQFNLKGCKCQESASFPPPPCTLQGVRMSRKRPCPLQGVLMSRSTDIQEY